MWRNRWSDFEWVGRIPVNTPVRAAAQERYRHRTAIQSLLVLVPVVTLVVGQITSLVGVVLDGTDADSLWFILTTATLVSSFGVIVSTALGELLRLVAR